MTIISINRWLFTNFPIRRLTRILSEIGFNAIELAARDILKGSCKSLESLRKCLDMYGLEVSAINAVTSFVPYIHGSISSKIPWRREKFLRLLENIIEKMTILGCTRLIISPGRQAENYQTLDEAWRTTVKSLRHLGKYAMQYHVEILLEPMPFRTPFIYSRNILRFINEVAQLNVHAAIDTGHVRLAGESLKSAMKNLGDLLRYVHLSNVRIEPGRPLLDEHRPLYDGSISPDEYKTLLSEIGDIPLAINIVTSEDPIICARKCLRLVRECHPIVS